MEYELHLQSQKIKKSRGNSSAAKQRNQSFETCGEDFAGRTKEDSKTYRNC